MLRYEHSCGLLPRTGGPNRAACYRWPALVVTAPARLVVTAPARLVVCCSSESSPGGSSSGGNRDDSGRASTASFSVSQGAEDSWKMLKEFTVKEFRGMSASFVSSREKRDELRSAVMAVYASPNPSRGWIPDSGDPDVLLGVVSSDVRLAVRACRDWCSALNLEYVSPEIRVPGVAGLAGIKGSVYIKYNARSKASSISVYQGRDRGVLLQLGQEQLGHFPLGLWDEDKQAPPPPL